MNSRLCSGHRVAPIRHVNGTVLTDNTSKAQAFNNYFVSVFNQSNPISNVPTSAPAITSNDVIFSPDVVYKALRDAKKPCHLALITYLLFFGPKLRLQ